LLELFLALVDARDVGEGDLVVALAQELGLRLPEGHGLAAGTLQLAHEQDEEDEEEHHRHPLSEDGEPEVVLLLLLVLHVHPGFPELLEHNRVGRRADGAEPLLGRLHRSGIGVPAEVDLPDLLLLDLRQERGERGFLHLVLVAVEDVEEAYEQGDQNHPESDGLVAGTHVWTAPFDSGRDPDPLPGSEIQHSDGPFGPVASTRTGTPRPGPITNPPPERSGEDPLGFRSVPRAGRAPARGGREATSPPPRAPAPAHLSPAASVPAPRRGPLRRPGRPGPAGWDHPPACPDPRACGPPPPAAPPP